MTEILQGTRADLHYRSGRQDNAGCLVPKQWEEVLRLAAVWSDGCPVDCPWIAALAGIADWKNFNDLALPHRIV